MEKKLMESVTSGESVKNLTEVLSKFLGTPVYMNLKIEKDRKEKESVYAISDPIDIQSMGICKFLFKKFTIGSFGSIYAPEDGQPCFELHASYEHPQGGSNGHSLGLGENRLMLVFDSKTSNWFIVTR